MDKLTGIAKLKPEKRRAAVDAEISAARVGGAETFDVSYHVSRFEDARAIRARIVEISAPLDDNGKQSLVMSALRGSKRELVTVGLHMVSAIAAASDQSSN
ncbi:hypothetical protein OG474_30590 [Kribbella sp. NBC_01505]|uniref:hypothetical protein n=1 Tax=Kribbella sp. NBC_01505 TaxID=2903580 RepID=UPI00386D43CD